MFVLMGAWLYRFSTDNNECREKFHLQDTVVKRVTMPRKISDVKENKNCGAAIVIRPKSATLFDHASRKVLPHHFTCETVDELNAWFDAIASLQCVEVEVEAKSEEDADAAAAAFPSASLEDLTTTVDDDSEAPQVVVYDDVDNQSSSSSSFMQGLLPLSNYSSRKDRERASFDGTNRDRDQTGLDRPPPPHNNNNNNNNGADEVESPNFMGMPGRMMSKVATHLTPGRQGHDVESDVRDEETPRTAAHYNNVNYNVWNVRGTVHHIAKWSDFDIEKNLSIMAHRTHTKDLEEGDDGGFQFDAIEEATRLLSILSQCPKMGNRRLLSSRQDLLQNCVRLINIDSARWRVTPKTKGFAARFLADLCDDKSNSTRNPVLECLVDKYALMESSDQACAKPLMALLLSEEPDFVYAAVTVLLHICNFKPAYAQALLTREKVAVLASLRVVIVAFLSLSLSLSLFSHVCIVAYISTGYREGGQGILCPTQK